MCRANDGYRKKHINAASKCVNLSHVQIYCALGFGNTQPRVPLSLTSTYLSRPQFIFQWHHPGQAMEMTFHGDKVGITEGWMK